MKTSTLSTLTLLLLVTLARGVNDDATAQVAAQKKTARDNWGELDIGEPAHHETAHLLLYAPKTMEKRLKDLGALLEKQYELARKPLGQEKEEPLPGKVAVYLLPERDRFTSMVRRLERRRVEREDSGSHLIEGAAPHVIAGPPQGKGDPGVEGQAAEQLAQALLQKKAGAKTPLPGWLLTGFGRATYHRVAPRDRTVVEDRKLAAALVKRGRAAREVWSNALEAEAAVPLQASLAGYFAYEMTKFGAFVEAFKPGENEEQRTTDQALEAAGVGYDTLNGRWRAWAAAQR